MNASLQHLLSPRSIAIVGASEDFSRINGRPLKFLLEKRYAGGIYPVYPKYQSIAAIPCYPNAVAIPGPVELAIVAVPAGAAQSVVDELAAAGVKAILNFAPARLETPLGVKVRNVDLAVDLGVLSFFVTGKK